MPDEIVIKTDPPDLFQRLNGYEAKLEGEMGKSMDKALFHVQDSVPDYPEYQSSYRRTGTLGRSLHIGGMGNVKDVKQTGGDVVGKFGTRVKYAQYVIGSETQARHMRHWWRMKDVKKKAEPGVRRIFEAMAKKVAGWLNGKGL
jgi:hypothetical protein